MKRDDQEAIACDQRERNREIKRSPSRDNENRRSQWSSRALI